MGCWKDIKEPCGSCFGCMNMDPVSISLDFKLRNGTAITSVCVFD